MNIAIVIPAYNEENRIGKTLDAYLSFFEHTDKQVTWIVVLNGCKDNTRAVVKERQKGAHVHMIDMKEAGKGYAIKKGFEHAVQTDADLIGFVDADMATRPEYFNELIEHYDEETNGLIASRYMKESRVYPPRPAIKARGRRFIYQPLVWLLLGLHYNDYQCGAKLFERKVIETITPHLTVRQWAFDAELMYLCKIFHFSIREWPTVWHDQAESKLTLRAGFRMLGSLFGIRWRHSFFGKKFSAIKE